MPDSIVEADHPDHEALRAFKSVFERAVGENQLDLLAPYLDEKFSIVSFTNREFSDFTAFKGSGRRRGSRCSRAGPIRWSFCPSIA